VDVRGKTILVTGAGRGIGRSLATHFARKGANLALLDMNADGVNETAADCAQLGVVARSYIANAANEDSVVEALDQVTADFGRLDGLINNAGIVRDAMLVKVRDGQVVGKMTLAQWQSVIDVNLTGVFLCAREAAQRMINSTGGGVIVNVSSMARFQALRDHAAYCASKAGLDQLTAVMAVELGEHGIRVNSVNPTIVLTEMGKRAWSDPAKGGPMLARIPLGRFAECEDIASVVCFLLSDAAGMLNGLALPIDGGFHTT